MDWEHEALQSESADPTVGSVGDTSFGASFGVASQGRRRAQPIDEVTAALGERLVPHTPTEASHFLSAEEVEVSVCRLAFGGYVVREIDRRDILSSRAAGSPVFATQSVTELLDFVEARLDHTSPLYVSGNRMPQHLPRSAPVAETIHTPQPLLEANLIAVIEAWFGCPLGREGLLRLQVVLRERNLPHGAVDQALLASAGGRRDSGVK